MARIWSLPAVLPAARIASPAGPEAAANGGGYDYCLRPGILLPRDELVGMIMR